MYNANTMHKKSSQLGQHVNSVYKDHSFITLHVRAINMNTPLEQLDKSFISFVDHTQNKPSQIHKPYTQNRHKKLKGKI